MKLLNMRKKIIIGNWKMNLDLESSNYLIQEIISKSGNVNVNIGIAPSFVLLDEAIKNTKRSKIKIFAQNLSEYKSGAYTGEVSASMLLSIGVENVIIGHSERRSIFNENHSILKNKVENALLHNMNVVFCFGEKLEDRKSNNYLKIISKQLNDSLFNLDANLWNNIILAYEPVWAIGTGETALPEQAQEIHSFVRNLISENYSKTLSEKISILYGGSVKPNNAQSIFSQKDVDGGLIGGASLDSNHFIEIINSI